MAKTPALKSKLRTTRKSHYPISPQQAILKLENTLCFECIKKQFSRTTESWSCLVFEDFYFPDSPNCESFSQDMIPWYEQLKSMINYATEKGEVVDPEIRKAFDHLDRFIEAHKYDGFQQVYHSEVHRDGAKMGGGEKQKGNKLFGKQRMKDNRYLEPWGHQDTIRLPKARKKKR